MQQEKIALLAEFFTMQKHDPRCCKDLDGVNQRLLTGNCSVSKFDITYLSREIRQLRSSFGEMLFEVAFGNDGS